MNELTVVCINKNSEKYIDQTLRSVLSQNFTDFKILIMDSNSTDKSVDIIKNINSRKIEIINLDENIDHHSAWLKGIQLVNSKYITFMTTTDGYIDNEWFNKAISNLNNDEKLSFVFANSIARDSNGNLTYINQSFYQKFEQPSHENFLPFYLATRYHINELNCIWHTGVVKLIIKNHSEINSNNIDPIANDLFEFLEFEAINEGYLGKYINTVANYGRIHENSITKKSELHNFSALKDREKIYKNKKKMLINKIKNNNFIFRDRNSNEISKVRDINFFNFYFIYYFFRLFYPQFKTSKPFFSLYYIFDKINFFIIKKFLFLLFNKIPKILTKKFFKAK